MGVRFDKIQSKLTMHDHDDLYHTKTVLASTGANDGASLVGIEDAADEYTATTVEGALTEVVKKVGDTMTGTLQFSGVPDLSGLLPLAYVTADFHYIYNIGEVIATQNYGEGTFVNNGSTYSFSVYPYTTINGVDYVASFSAFVSSTDDGGNDNVYSIGLSWDAVTGADGYLIVSSDTGYGVKTGNTSITINALADFTITPGDVALEKYAVYTNDGYTFNYRAYHYDEIYEYCSADFIELVAPITDDAGGGANFIVVIDYGDDAGAFVTIQDGYNGYNFDQGVFGTNNIAVDYGGGGDPSILGTITAIADAVYSATNGATFGGNLKVGDIARIKNVPYSFPESNVTGILNNDGDGNLSWSPESVTDAEITALQAEIDAVAASIPDVSGLLPKDGSQPMTGLLPADEGVLISQNQTLKEQDMAYVWAKTIFASAGLTNAYAMVQDDNYFYFAGAGLQSGYVFRVDKSDYTLIETVPVVKADGTLDQVYRLVVSNDKRFIFYAGQNSVGKIELGSFGQAASYTHSYGIGDTQMILVDDTKVYLMVPASASYSLVFDQDTFSLVFAVTYAGSSSIRGGAVVGTDMYLVNSTTDSTVYKYDLTDETLATYTSLTLTGNNTGYGCVVDNGFLYVVHSLSPTKVSKIDLSSFTLTTTLTLTSQNTGRSISTDGTYLYVTQYLSPVRITRILISDFATFSTLTAASGYNLSYNTIADNGYLYTAFFSTNSTFMKTEASAFASPTYHKYGGVSSNLTKIAGRNNRQFACVLNSTNVFYVDYTKRVVKYIEVPYAISCMVYEELTNFVYAISNDSTSAKIMVLDLSTGTLARTIDPGFSHTSAISVASMASSGYMILINGTNGEGIIYDTVNNAIIDTQSGAHLESISQLVWNSLISGYVYGIRFDGTVFRISNDLTGGTDYGAIGLATLADVPLSLSDQSVPWLTICGKTDWRVFLWDITGDPDFGTIFEYTVDNVGTLGGAVYSEDTDCIAAMYQSVSNAQVTIYNRATAIATKYTSTFTSSTSTDSMIQVQVDNSGGSTVVNVLCQFGSAYQFLIGVNTAINTIEQPYLQLNDPATEPTLVDALSSTRIGKEAGTVELIGKEVTALGTLRALFGFITSGFSAISGYVKYMMVGDLNVADALKIGVGEAGVDYQIEFDGEDNDGTIIWKEDENYFQFENDVVFGVGAGIPFGGISVEDNSTATTIGSASTYVQVTVFDTDNLSNNTTPDHTNDHITITIPGIYRIEAHGDCHDGDVNDNYEIAVCKNNGATVLNGGLRTHIFFDFASSEPQFAIAGFAELDVNDTIEVWVKNNTAGNNITFEFIALSIQMVAGASS